MGLQCSSLAVGSSLSMTVKSEFGDDLISGNVEFSYTSGFMICSFGWSFAHEGGAGYFLAIRPAGEGTNHPF